MKKTVPNIIFIILGIISITLVFRFNIDGTLGLLLTSVGVIFIGIGTFKGNNPFKVIFQFISNFF